MTTLTLYDYWQYHRDEISVVDSDTKAPIPYKWTGPETIEIDDIFATRAQVLITPKPRSQRT